MEHQNRETISSIRDQSYQKGYMDGYLRGIEDYRSGSIRTFREPELLDKPIQFLNLTKRPFNSLDRAGYRTIRQIVSLPQEEIWKIRNLGHKGLHEVAWALWNLGIRDSRWNEWL